jgi:NDP-sugar pyrophosphorylase family protein
VDLDLHDVFRFHRENHAAVTMVLRRDPEAERYGVIETDGYGLVRQVLGRLPVRSGPWNRLMFTGVHVLEPEVFSYMEDRQDSFSIIDVYLDMLRGGERIMGYEMKGSWTDLGTRARYEDFQRMVEGGEIELDALVRADRGEKI